MIVFSSNGQTADSSRHNIHNVRYHFSQTTSDWVEMSPTASPPARYHHGMQAAYDSQSDRVILFSGDIGDKSVIFNDTWAYDYNTDTWENRTTPEMKDVAKLAGAMAYDEESDRIILVGGWKWANGSSVEQSTGLVETWSYDYESNIWVNLTTENSPSFRGSVSLNYDEANDKMIMFGGFNSEMYETPETTIPFYHDTWAYDYNTNTWTNMSPTVSPPPLGNHESAYDSESNKTIIFGGRRCRNCYYLAETWAYDYSENTWTKMNSTRAPPVRAVGMMTYIPKIDKIVMFGGLGVGKYYSDTWTYDYNTDTWTDMNSPSPPSARFAHNFDYDSESDVVILFGGRTHDSNGLMIHSNDTWVYHYQPNIPSVPLNLEATKSNGEVNLTWTAPLTDAGSPITEYVIYRGNESDSLILYKTILGVETKNYLDTEVSGGTTYYYTVRAKNTVGESKDSNVVSITLPSSPDVPGFSLVLMSAIIVYLVILRRRSN